MKYSLNIFAQLEPYEIIFKPICQFVVEHYYAEYGVSECSKMINSVSICC